MMCELASESAQVAILHFTLSVSWIAFQTREGEGKKRIRNTSTELPLLQL